MTKIKREVRPSVRDYQLCSRCVMDTSDADITFDSDGVCNHCHEFDAHAARMWKPGPEGEADLAVLVERMKKAGRSHEYDCIIGLSGGLDSTYLALKMAERDLRILAVHVDAGWNSEIAVYNIERTVQHSGLDLFTYVVDWEDMRNLQVAYFRSGIANLDVPQDHVFFATLYQQAVKQGIKHVLNGGNLATEGIFPKSWHGPALDRRNLLAIQAKCGTEKLTSSYTTVSFFNYYIMYPYVRRIVAVRPLNLMPYDRANVLNELTDTIGYKPYGRKHGESLFTRFFQNHVLPYRFGFDKRRPHLSSMVVSGQLTREDALLQLEAPLYEPDDLARDMEFVARKLRMPLDELEGLLDMPLHHYDEFPTQQDMYRTLKQVQGLVERTTGRRLGRYGG